MVVKEEFFVDWCQILGILDVFLYIVGSNYGENGVVEIEVSKFFENLYVFLFNNQIFVVDIVRVFQFEIFWDDKDVEVDIV